MTTPTPEELDDLCNWLCNSGQIDDRDLVAAADAIAALREEVEQTKEAARQLFQQLQKAEADNAALLTIVRDCREPIDNLLCPTQWKTAEGRTHSDLCKRITAMLTKDKP